MKRKARHNRGRRVLGALLTHCIDILKLRAVHADLIELHNYFPALREFELDILHCPFYFNAHGVDGYRAFSILFLQPLSLYD